MKRIAVAFVGDRLKDIRESFGMNTVTLSTLLGVHRNSIGDYESGAVPDEAVMSKLVELFQVPRYYFFTPIQRQKHTQSLFRAGSKVTKSEKRRAEVIVEWAQEIDTVLRNHLALPRLNLPDLDHLPANPLNITQDHLVEVARNLRSHWNLGTGPIPNVVAVFERNGFVIIHVPLQSDDIDALSYSDRQGRPYILVNSDKISSVRLRLTTCHEAVHQIIHKSLPSDFDYSSSQSRKFLETQVNALAMEFLLGPEFLDEVSSVSLATLRALKSKWKVSMQAMLRYLLDQGVIEKSRYTSLHTYMSKLQWRTFEPLDEEIAIERPTLFKASFDAITKKMNVPRESLAAKLILPESIICKVAHLPSDYFFPQEIKIKASNPPKNIKFGT